MNPESRTSQRVRKYSETDEGITWERENGEGKVGPIEHAPD